MGSSEEGGDVSSSASEAGGDVSATATTDVGTTGGSTADETSGTPTTGGTTGGGADACACIPPGNSTCNVSVVCELPMPCARVTVTCPRGGGDLYGCGSELVFDEEALGCALATLEAGTPAHLLIDGTEDWTIDTPRHELFAVGDGSGIKTSCFPTDIGDQGESELDAIEGPDHFAGCLELAAPHDRYDCLWAGITKTGDAPVCE